MRKIILIAAVLMLGACKVEIDSRDLFRSPPKKTIQTEDNKDWVRPDGSYVYGTNIDDLNRQVYQLRIKFLESMQEIYDLKSELRK